MDTKGPVLSNRLTGVDAAFLYLERKEIPLNIASVMLFDGPIPFEEFVENIDSRLHLIPRYRQVATPPPFHLGNPTWEQDPNFDIRRHIFPLRLDAPGGEAELEAATGHILSRVMDRAKPLWEIYVVERLKDGRGALIARLHHALADGVAGAALIRVMLDPTPEGSHAIRKTKPHPVEPPAQPASLADQLSQAVHSALENLIAAEAGLLDFAQKLLTEQMQAGLQGLMTLLPEVAAPVDRFPFNKPCTGDRKFCWAEFDFADLKSIKNALTCTINDVVLTLVTRAVARYVRLHGEPTEGRLIKVVCPVNVRGEENGESMGNRISFLPVVLPLDIPDATEMVHAVATRMAIMKSVRAAELLAVAGSSIGAAPTPLQELFWWGVPLLPLPAPLFNMIITNVPGSPTPLYSMGRRLLSAYPQVPTGYELGLGIAVQSYAGKLCVGITSDAHVAPDAGRLREFLRLSFQELCAAAGLKKKAERKPIPPRTRTRPTRKAPPKPAPVADKNAAEEEKEAVVAG